MVRSPANVFEPCKLRPDVALFSITPVTLLPILPEIVSVPELLPVLVIVPAMFTAFDRVVPALVAPTPPVLRVARVRLPFPLTGPEIVILTKCCCCRSPRWLRPGCCCCSA